MLAAEFWIGGLLSLFYMVGAAQRREFDSAVLMRALGRFSLIGFGAVLFIIASGLLNSWFLVGSLHALLHMAYGQVLMVKVSLFLHDRSGAFQPALRDAAVRAESRYG